MNTWIYDNYGNCVGSMDDYYIMYDAGGGRMGYINDRSGEIFGPYDNYVGNLSLRGEIRNPMNEVCGYVNNDGEIYNSYRQAVGYVTETDEYNRMMEGVSDVMSRVAGAAAWLLNFL